MARETKEDRLVRSMLDQMTEHLHELKNLEQNPSSKEMDVERWCQGILKSVLGFSAVNGYSIRSQEAKGKMRPDLVVYKDDKPVFVVEVKKFGFDLNKSDFRSGRSQLSEYLKHIGNVSYGVLSNGHEWRLFDFSSQYGAVEVASLDLRNDEDQLEIGKRAVDEAAWEFLDFHEQSFNSGVWTELAREATAFSPDSLAKAVLSVDVVKQVAKAIRGEHDYRANLEVLVGKVLDLLTKGLDDSIPGWNEEKLDELKKYAKSQKRASRKKKRSSKGDVVHPATSSEVVAVATVSQDSSQKPAA